MNGKRILATLIVMLILLLGASQATGQQDGPQSPQGTVGTAFTYQGQLRDAGGPINGTCDLRFRLFNAASGGSQVGGTVTHEGVGLVDGLFTARLDFGAGAFQGDERWLEIEVRCPAGSGDYATLTPRQELTAAPAALALKLPYTAQANLGGPVATFHNTGDGEAALFRSDLGSALWVESAAADGVYVGPTGQNGLAVGTAGTNGLLVGTAGANGLHVNSASHNGVLVDAAGGRGLAVEAAGSDGVYVGRAGSPSAVTPNEFANGVEVAGAEGYGLYVGRTGRSGVLIDSTYGDGIAINSAGGDGYYVSQANARGLGVGVTGGDGVYVQQAGTPSSRTSNPQPNGFEVAGAKGYGLYVGRADLDGVYVNSSAWHGVNINGSGVNGVYVTNAGNYGVAVASAAAGGVYGRSANGPGVRAESDKNDGVVGWTGSGSKSGVLGYSQTGNGVTGISDGQYGVLAITTSSDPKEAALLAHNQGAGPAVEARGDLVVTGAYRGNIGPNGGAPFPRPAYDSGWVALALGETKTLTHNLGGNVDNYVVIMSHRCYYGGPLIPPGYNNAGDGEYYLWMHLTDRQIDICRKGDDSLPNADKQYRVRIWVYQ